MLIISEIIISQIVQTKSSLFCNRNSFLIVHQPERKFCSRTQKLTLSQTTNFKLFQNLKSLQTTIPKLIKWQKVLQTGKKHCRKKEKFSLSIFKRLLLQTCKNQGLFGKGLNLFQTTKLRVNPSTFTHYQTTNFRLFQTERVCRRQFQI